MLGYMTIEVSLAAVATRRQAGVKLIKRKGFGQTENSGADVREKVAQDVLDLSSRVDVLVAHQHFIIEVVSGSKVQSGGGGPAETPQDGSFTGNAGPELSTVGQEKRA